ncbi:DUF1569 domain-containing protein [Pedobacter boryungensis]|uniref:DUF1569 domain-containing protein n=1 Tax=Pedobacter boryungensis TaxID=869962 RepID=A0ABX2DD31_9SPHI|nr:DUF1569 domain-containing protein [Pedobacter boryungensis]NQX31860.1 DUF1569 domain-containing protein [Pedobacter boryungensis]
MKSLFNTDDREEIINRIQSITATSEKQWGKMSASQMLLHAQAPIKVGIGELKLNSNLIFMILGPIIKKKLMKEEPFEHNLPTHKSFIVGFDPNLDAEKENLINLIHKFNAQKDNLAIKHPIFGKMSTQQWDVLLWKHTDHHLRQFGV